jgi:hypothetical protein
MNVVKNIFIILCFFSLKSDVNAASVKKERAKKPKNHEARNTDLKAERAHKRKCKRAKARMQAKVKDSAEQHDGVLFVQEFEGSLREWLMKHVPDSVTFRSLCDCIKFLRPDLWYKTRERKRILAASEFFLEKLEFQPFDGRYELVVAFIVTVVHGDHEEDDHEHEEVLGLEDTFSYLNF